MEKTANKVSTEREAAECREAMFASVMRAYLGSDEEIRIQSTLDITGGNNSLSIRRRDVLFGGRVIPVVEKMPSIHPASRIGLNLRELWLYDHLLNRHLSEFAPKFYGSCTRGPLMLWAFEHIEGVRPETRVPSVSEQLLHVVARMNRIAVPDPVPVEPESIGFMAPDKVRANAELAMSEIDLRRFHGEVASHDARFRGLKRGLSHGDLHGGNILLDRGGRTFFIDWSRWGAHPVGSDVGKYLLGAVHRSKSVRVRDHLRRYAEVVSADLDDVVFSARYTRIGFLLSMLARRKQTLNRHAVAKEVTHHLKTLGRGR